MSKSRADAKTNTRPPASCWCPLSISSVLPPSSPRGRAQSFASRGAASRDVGPQEARRPDRVHMCLCRSNASNQLSLFRAPVRFVAFYQSALNGDSQTRGQLFSLSPQTRPAKIQSQQAPLLASHQFRGQTREHKQRRRGRWMARPMSSRPGLGGQRTRRHQVGAQTDYSCALFPLAAILLPVRTLINSRVASRRREAAFGLTPIAASTSTSSCPLLPPLSQCNQSRWSREEFFRQKIRHSTLTSCELNSKARSLTLPACLSVCLSLVVQIETQSSRKRANFCPLARRRGGLP